MKTLSVFLWLGPGLVQELLSTRCLLSVLVCFLPLAGLDDLLDFELSCSAFDFVVLCLIFFCASFDDRLDVATLFRLPFTLGTSDAFE